MMRCRAVIIVILFHSGIGSRVLFEDRGLIRHYMGQVCEHDYDSFGWRQQQQQQQL